MPQPKPHILPNGRPCGGHVKAIYAREATDQPRLPSGQVRTRWIPLGWMCDRCHKWAEDEWELTR